MGFLRDENDADDTAQEVFIKVFQSIGNFRDESQLSTWIYRIAVTKSLGFLRKRKRQNRAGFFSSVFGGSKTTIYDREGYHPGIALEHKEKAQILFEAIDRLPERQNVAFTLHKVEDLSYKEISKVMKVSVSSVESLLFRAKANLRKYLSDFYYKEV